MIAAKQILDILESIDFQNDLAELGSYGASIRPERAVVLLFAKQLWKRGGYKYSLESKYNRVTGERPKDKCDLSVNGKTIEFKVHFDSDLLTVERDLRSCGEDLERMWYGISVEKKNKTWGVCPGIYEDMIVKHPSFFIWIVCSRDIDDANSLPTTPVIINDHIRYRRTVPFDSKGEYLHAAQRVLDKVNLIRPFRLRRTSIATNGLFPSVYHLFLCEFLDSND